MGTDREKDITVQPKVQKLTVFDKSRALNENPYFNRNRLAEVQAEIIAGKPGIVVQIPERKAPVKIKAVKETEKKIRVAGYCRVSTGLVQQLTSIDAQRSHYEAYIRSNPDWEFAGIYWEAEVSATKTKNRPEAFQRVQGKLMQMEHDRLVTGKRTRMSKDNAIFGKISCGQCGDHYVRYIQNDTFIWRCYTRAKCRHDCTGRQAEETEIIQAAVSAFNRLPEKREDLIRMQERIMWGPLDRISREITELDKKKNELEGIVNRYASTGAMERRVLLLYCKEDEEIDEERAVARISEEIAGMKDKRDALLCEKGELGFQEAKVQTLFKLTNSIMDIPLNSRTLIKTGTDNAAAGETERDPAACYDVYDFYQRTDNITQHGPVKEYDNELTRRFVEKFVIQPDGIDVQFKAGITISVKTPEWAKPKKRTRKKKEQPEKKPDSAVQDAD